MFFRILQPILSLFRPPSASSSTLTDNILEITQEFTWNVATELEITKVFDWNTGPTPLYWYQVQGSCMEPSCATASIDVGDMGCESSAYIQTVAARGISDLCEKLKSGASLTQPIKWPIQSIKKFSRPVDKTVIRTQEAAGIDHSCNVLADEEFITVPECLDISLTVDAVVTGGIITTLQDVNIEMVLSLNSLSVEESDEILIGLSDIELESTAGAVVSLSDFEVEFIETSGDPLEEVTDSVDVFCSCGRPTPLSLNLSHNLATANKLYYFLNRNNLTLPSPLNIYYDSLNQVWRNGFSLKGTSELGTLERWDIVFEWACASEVNGINIGAASWKLSVSIQEVDLTSGYALHGRFLFITPIAETCSKTDRLRFTFFLDTKLNVLETQPSADAEIIVFKDEMGLFSTKQWFDNPNLIFTVSESLIDGALPRYDIQPIFPTEPTFLNS